MKNSFQKHRRMSIASGFDKLDIEYCEELIVRCLKYRALNTKEVAEFIGLNISTLRNYKKQITEGLPEPTSSQRRLFRNNAKRFLKSLAKKDDKWKIVFTAKPQSWVYSYFVKVDVIFNGKTYYLVKVGMIESSDNMTRLEQFMEAWKSSEYSLKLHTEKELKKIYDKKSVDRKERTKLCEDAENMIAFVPGTRDDETTTRSVLCDGRIAPKSLLYKLVDTTLWRLIAPTEFLFGRKVYGRQDETSLC
jgi:hypothetical protein